MSKNNCQEKNKKNSLNSWIIKDLENSGLNAQTIEKMSVIPIPSGKKGIGLLKSHLGFSSLEGHENKITRLTDCYFIPYTQEPYCRLKLRYPIKDEGTKYLSPSKAKYAKQHVYYLSEWEKVIDRKNPLLITEGEKKTAKLYQEGFTAVGLPGVSTWSTVEELKSGELLKSLIDRDVYILFDMDKAINPEVQRELAGLYFLCLKHKAKVKVCSWDTEYKGIDDYLVSLPQENQGKAIKDILANSSSDILDICPLLESQDFAGVLARAGYSRARADLIWQKYLVKRFKGEKRLFNSGLKAHKSGKGGEVIEKGKSFYLRVKSEEIELSNFSFRIEKTITDDNGDVSYSLALENTDGEKGKVVITGETLADSYMFSHEVSKKGYFVLYQKSNSNFLKIIDYVRKVSEPVSLRKTAFLGLLENGKEYLTRDKKVSSEGLSVSDIICPDNHIKVVDMIKDKACEVMEQLFHDFSNLYRPYTAITLIGFAVSSLFVSAITQEYSGFPLLYVTGSKGCGKNTLATFLQSLFGCQREGLSFNLGMGSTRTSIQRSFMKYRGVPIILNEYRGTNKENRMLSGLYDREVYERAKFDNSLDNVQMKMNSTGVVLSTRYISGYEAQALLSRFLVVELPTPTESSKVLVSQMIKREKLYSCFIPLALGIEPEQLLRDIETYITRLRTDTSLEARTCQNYGIILGSCTHFLKKYTNIDVWKVKETIENYIKEVIRTRQREIDKENPALFYASVLLTYINNVETEEDFAESARLLDHQKILLFSLTDTYPHIRRFLSQTREIERLPDKKTLKKEFKKLGVKTREPEWINGRPQRRLEFDVRLLGE